MNYNNCEIRFCDMCCSRLGYNPNQKHCSPNCKAAAFRQNNPDKVNRYNRVWIKEWRRKKNEKK